MDVEVLHEFLQICDAGSYVRAAEALGVSQSALTKRIARLERQLGARLLQRGVFGAHPTAAGRVVMDTARRMCAERRVLELELGALEEGRAGEVRLGVGVSVTGRILPLACRELYRRHPGVGVVVVEAMYPALVSMLLRGELDLLVTAPHAEFEMDHELHVRPVFTDSDVVTLRARHPLAGKRGVTPAQLAKFPWVIARQVAPVRERLWRAFLAAGAAPPKQVLLTDSAQVTKSLLLQGDYVALLSPELMQNECAANLLVTPDLPELRQTRQGLIVYRRRYRLHAAAQAVADAVVVACRQLYPGRRPRR